MEKTINNNSIKKKKHTIIAISGMPAAGKTTISKELLKRIPKLVYFDFGAFFRPITYYLLKEKNIQIVKLYEIINNNKIEQLMEHLDIGYRNNNGVYEFSIRNVFYEDEVLYNPEMNKLTVDIGTCLGDSLNKYIDQIIENIRMDNPVLLNARRPLTVCKNVSNHIFLKADFKKRAERKAVIEQTSFEEAVERLKKRDEKEIRAGFWETFSFTKVIDTTEMQIEDTINQIMAHIMEYTIKNEELYKIDEDRSFI